MKKPSIKKHSWLNASLDRINKRFFGTMLKNNTWKEVLYNVLPKYSKIKVVRINVSKYHIACCTAWCEVRTY